MISTMEIENGLIDTGNWIRMWPNNFFSMFLFTDGYGAVGFWPLEFGSALGELRILLEPYITRCFSATFLDTLGSASAPCIFFFKYKQTLCTSCRSRDEMISFPPTTYIGRISNSVS